MSRQLFYNLCAGGTGGMIAAILPISVPWRLSLFVIWALVTSIVITIVCQKKGIT